ncbi:MAG: flagellar filament capping protein FliD [Thermodesulfobacteriota bacterium]
MAGAITTLGVGSGIDLQGMLEDLREIDQQVVNRKQTEITRFENRLTGLSTVNNKLLSLKSAALNLSLSGSFLGRTVTSSDEKVAKATVLDGTTAQTLSLDVTKVASRSSWLSSAGTADTDTSVYVPVSAESASGVADPAVDIVARAGETLDITFAGADTMSLAIAGDMTMNDLVSAINSHVDNVGGGDNGRLVTAETYELNGETFLRIRSDLSGGTGEANRVAISETLADLDFTAPDKTLFYKVGDGDVVSIAVAADTTLAGLADLINGAADNAGVTAKVINDGDAATPYRLSLQSGSTGEDGRISFLSQLPDLVMAEQEGAGGASLNAQFAVDGINYQRQTNAVSNVISGLTINLEGAGSATITISKKDEAIREMVESLVSAYNAALTEMKTTTGYDSETEEFGVLARTTVRDLPYTLQRLMTSSVQADETGAIRSLFDLGLEFNRDGSISLNDEMFDQALADNPDGVSSFFLGDSDRNIEGFADKVNNQLRYITGENGQIEGEKSSAQARIADLELKIEQETNRLDKKYELLTKQFIELDRYMNQMTSLSGYLANQFDSIAKAWGGGDK